MQGQSGLAGGLRAIDLNDTSLRQTTDAQRRVDGQDTGGDNFNLDVAVLAELDDGAFAEVLLQLAEGGFQSLLPLFGVGDLCNGVTSLGTLLAFLSLFRR